MFGRSTANFDKLLESATSHLLLEPDWTLILQLCDSIRQQDVQPKYAVSAIKKKLYSPNPHVALYSFQVLESCVKNCGSPIHQEVVSRQFMEELRELIKVTNHETVKNKILELIQAWAHAFRQEPNYQEELEQVSLGKVDYWQKAERNQSLVTAAELLVSLEKGALGLQSVVEGSQAWNNMKQSLEALALRLHTLNQQRPQRVQDLLGVTPETKAETPAVKVKTANSKTASDKRVEGCSSDEKREKRSRFWRVFRAGLPLQVAMVLLYCLAWLMEPQCCDFLNSMHFTFSPTLRYLKGPPPT